MALGSTARKPVGQQLCYLRKRLLRSAGTPQTISVGKIPAGSNIVAAWTNTRTAFSGTTPVFSLGVLGNLANIVASAANGLAALGFSNLTVVAANAGAVPDTDIEVLASFSGDAGGTTSAIADIQVAYIPPDETP